MYAKVLLNEFWEMGVKSLSLTVCSLSSRTQVSASLREPEDLGGKAKNEDDTPSPTIHRDRHDRVGCVYVTC